MAGNNSAYSLGMKLVMWDSYRLFNVDSICINFCGSLSWVHWEKPHSFLAVFWSSLALVESRGHPLNQTVRWERCLTQLWCLLRLRTVPGFETRSHKTWWPGVWEQENNCSHLLFTSAPRWPATPADLPLKRGIRTQLVLQLCSLDPDFWKLLWRRTGIWTRVLAKTPHPLVYQG